MRLLSLVLLSFVFLFASCVNEDSKASYLPGNSGNQGEILVVAPTALWASDESNYLKKGLLKLFDGLPAEEPLFTSIEVKTESFGNVFKTHRNILEFRIDKTNKTSVIKRENIYAKQQTQVIVTLNNFNDLQGFVSAQFDRILWTFHNAEIDRLSSRNKAFGPKDLNEEVAKISGLVGIIQEDFEIATKAPGFLWLRLDREKPIGGYQHAIKQGLMIYSRPYVDTAQFSDSSLIAWKLAVNEQHIPGPKTSYMGIEDRFIKPTVNTINFRGTAAKEIRGLWRMQGAKGVFMGGPFYALSFYNDINKQQYLVEGYVYGPQFNKRTFVREIEAVVKSYKPAPE